MSFPQYPLIDKRGNVLHREMEWNITTFLPVGTRIKTRILPLLSVLLFTSCFVMGQSPKSDVEQQDALELIKATARTLKSETDKIAAARDRKSTRLNSSHLVISYAVLCLKKKKAA